MDFLYSSGLLKIHLHYSPQKIVLITNVHKHQDKHPVGGKVKSLATLSKWSNPDKLNLQTPNGFGAWVRWMYDLPA